MSKSTDTIVKSLIEAIADGKMLKAESLFNTAMSTRAIESMENMKKSVGKNMFKKKG